METRRVLILSEPGLLAQGMRSLLESDPRIEIVGVTADVKRALEILRDDQPKVILVDADQFRLSLEHARATISLDWVPTLIAISHHDNTFRVCRIEETALTGTEDLIAAVST